MSAGEQGDAVEYALEVRGLTKRFGGAIAVDDLSLAVPRGSFYGLVGPNGAGKTTALSMATGSAAAGRRCALVHGVDVWRQPLDAKPLIGNLADGVDLYDRLTGEQLITFSGMMFGLDRATLRGRVADLLQLLDLESAAGRLVADYSAGMTKKIALAAALVHSPRLLVLDEPFESVDPVSAANIRDILVGFAKGGGTVVVSSHSMDLVERMCDHVAIMSAGRVLVSGTMDEVRRIGRPRDAVPRSDRRPPPRRGPGVVAVLLRLRFRILANTLQRNTFQLVAVIVGAALTAAMVAVALAGMLLASALPPEVTQAVWWSAAPPWCSAGSSCRCCSTGSIAPSIRSSSHDSRCARLT